MNTKPDDTTLALWLDDELEGDALAEVEAWAQGQPEQLEAREEIRRWRALISGSLPATEEPPAAEFFNERVQHAIRVTHHQPTGADGRASWRGWWMPFAACAGMAAAFLLGIKSQPLAPDSAAISGHGEGPASYTNVYTPEQGVEAEYFTNASATVIVLSGVEAIPDRIDFSATVAKPSPRDIDSTAGLKPETHSDR